MESETLESKNVSNYTYLEIKKMISQYQLIPGQKIIYDHLAKKLNVSKTPIINALSRLEQDGFVVLIPNRGFFIREVDIEEVAELFMVREVLEVLAAEESVKRINPKMLKEIEKAKVAHQAYDYTTPTRNRLALDAIFHLKISEMAGNHILTKLLRLVLDHIYVGNRPEAIPPKRIIKTTEEHEEIYEAIKEENISKAKRVVKKHIRAGKINIIQAIQKG
jgi:DNA-binding GntR family transcriptional regulator